MRFFVIGGIIVLLIAVVWGITHHQLGQTHDFVYDASDSLHVPEVRKTFTAALAHVGSAKAYNDIKKAYQDTNFDLQHNIAHIVGETFYDFHGNAGIAYCDSSFAFGCYHGFFTRSVASEGISIVPLLDEACGVVNDVESSGCRHGIGHGVLEYLGVDNLSRALDTCRNTTQIGPLVGCTSGVFMEYNVPLREQDDGTYSTIPREFNSENPFTPCDAVEYEFQQSCYHELPQWWVQIFNHDYFHIGTLCASLNNEMSEVCFLGMGKVIAPSMQFDPENTRVACESMPDERGKYFCASAASWSIARDGGGIEDSKIVCAETRPEYHRSCPIDSQ